MRRISVLTLTISLMAVTTQAQILQHPVIPRTNPPPAKPPSTPYVPSPSNKPIITIPHIETPTNLGQPQPQPKPQYKYTSPPYIPQANSAQKPPKTLNDWMAEAEAGDAAAAMFVAQSDLYREEPGAARKWYTIAAIGGNVEAMMILGELYEHAGSQVGETIALSWYKKAADTDPRPDSPARAKVCKAYISGRGNDIDIKAALPYCGRDDAQTGGLTSWAMGHAYEIGMERARDMAEAKRFYTLAAAQGMPEAMIDLGRLAEAAKDYASAFGWYQKAADTHALLAARPLAVMYENGWGVTPDVMMATWLYRLSATSGDRRAMAWAEGHPVSDLEKEINAPLLLNTLEQPVATATFTDAQGQVQTATFGSQFALMAEYYPARAMDSEVSGVAQFTCRVSAEYKLSPCFIESEFPEGYGFGRSTLKVVLNRDWVFQSKDKSGKDTKGRILHLAVKWQM